MTAELTDLLARHIPGMCVTSVRALAEGEDNRVYEVNGDLIVRESKDPDPKRRSASVGAEAGLLDLVGGISPLPVPRPILVDPVRGLIAYCKLPGRSLLTAPPVDPTSLAPALGAFLSSIHGIDLQTVARLVPRDLDPPGSWLEEARANYDLVASEIPAGYRREVESFLHRDPPARPTDVALCHSDLGAEHLLADPSRSHLTGVLDWADASLADPAVDLALILRDLGPEALDSVVDHYSREVQSEDRERVVFYARCRLLEDLAYGLAPGHGIYARAALDHLAHVFSPTA
ncbi:MAG: phosphotransferase family protein [Actinomycetota bacterium]